MGKRKIIFGPRKEYVYVIMCRDEKQVRKEWLKLKNRNDNVKNVDGFFTPHLRRKRKDKCLGVIYLSLHSKRNTEIFAHELFHACMELMRDYMIDMEEDVAESFSEGMEKWKKRYHAP